MSFLQHFLLVDILLHECLGDCPSLWYHDTTPEGAEDRGTKWYEIVARNDAEPSEEDDLDGHGPFNDLMKEVSTTVVATAKD